MKKVLFTAFALMLSIMVLAPAAVAIPFGVGESITVDRPSWHGTNNGGEFSIFYPTTDYPNLPSFYSFCIETGEQIGTPETVVVGHISTFIYTNGPNPGIPIALAPKAAFLYESFAKNNWTGMYDYTGGAQEILDGTALQAAIWFEQYGGTNPSNKFTTYAETIPSGYTTGDVVVLALYGATGAPKQDMLALTTGVITPEPMTLLLLGLGLVGIGVARRKK